MKVKASKYLHDIKPILLRLRDRLLEEIRAVIREELRDVEFISAQEKTEQPQAGDVDDNVLGFLLALQNDGGDE